MSHFQDYLNSHDACDEAREWCGERTAEAAWKECERADWLLWWCAKAGVDRKQIVTLACLCARRALSFATDPRCLAAIEAAERWVHGRATIAEVRAARRSAAYAADAAAYAADAAAYAADAAAYAAHYAAYAAYYAAYAAYAADAAHYAADAAAYAAHYAAYAAYYAAYAAYAADAAHYATLRHSEHVAMCAIIRAHIAGPSGPDWGCE